jgi:hypothetical protein
MENQPPSEADPVWKIPADGAGASVRLRVIAEHDVPELDSPREVVSRLQPENGRQPHPLPTAAGVPTPGNDESQWTPAETPELLQTNRDEPEWGPGATPRAGSGRASLVLAAGAFAIVLAGALLLLMRQVEPGNVSAAEPNKPAVAAPEDPLQWYRENPDLADTEANALLEAYARATTVEEVLGLVRAPERIEPLLRDWWRPFTSPLRTAGPGFERDFRAVGATTFYCITAELENFTKVRVYFVRTDGKMKIDWQASVAYSAVAADKLTASPGLHAAEVRCIIEARDISMPGYPAGEYSGYLLTIPGSQDLLWGLARIGSEVDEMLLDSLDRGRFLLELKTSERVTLEIDEARGAPANYFLISKFKHVEWVSP